ncbi:MAG: HEAT repeat domain-containing protein [Fimbriiglobus sp.]
MERIHLDLANIRMLASNQGERKVDVMAKKSLGEQLEAMSHHGRVRTAVEWGRQSVSDPILAKELRSWEAGGFMLRLMAVYASHGHRDTATLVRLTADASRTIAGLAFHTLGYVGNDDALLEVLQTLPRRRASKVLFRLRKSRGPVVDRYLESLVTSGEASVWPLIPLGSHAVLDRHFTQAAELGGRTFWKRLAVLHPQRASLELQKRLKAAKKPDGQLFYAANLVIDLLCKRSPELALELVLALQPHVGLAKIDIYDLARRLPVEVADLLLKDRETAHVNFSFVVEKLGVKRIVAICRKHSAYLPNPSDWLPKLPTADREKVYRELGPSWTTAKGQVSQDIIACLPAKLRVREAERMLALPNLAAQPLQRLPYAGLLTWEGVQKGTENWLGHPEAEYRAASLEAYCRSTRYDGSQLGGLIELLKAREFEQDPVRLAFLTELGLLPPSRWQAEHLEGLAVLIRQALDAADLSYASVSSLGRLAVVLLPFHPEWAVEQLLLITRERGETGWNSCTLSLEAVKHIAPKLTPILKTWLKRENQDRILWIANSVGRHLKAWPALAAILEEILFKASAQYTASSAMTLLLKHLPRERDRIVTATLAKDESWILHSSVYSYVHARRQDLLTPFLGDRTYKGRFSTGRVYHILPFESGFFRWTDAQQVKFAKTLVAVSKKPKKKNDGQLTQDILSLLRRLAAIPAIGPESLIEFARDTRPAVKETAVRALGRLDTAAGLPELLAALEDARARWAIYALRALLREDTPAKVLTFLQTVPLRKITVAKEVVRLAGELGGEGVLNWFAELHERKLHRDVRAAMLRGLWDHLERDETWAILEASAQSPEVGVVIGLASIPTDRASKVARERVANLFLTLLEHPETTVRMAVLGRLMVSPIPDPDRRVLQALLAKLQSPIADEQATALRAALAAATKEDAAEFAAGFRNLFDQPRELVEVVRLFVANGHYSERLTAVRLAVLAELESEPKFVTLQIPLATIVHDAKGFAEWVLKLSETPKWQMQSITTVMTLLGDVSRSHVDLNNLEAIWAKSEEPTVRWLALKVLERSTALSGWTKARIKRLEEYQADPSPLVADQAALVFPPP